MSARPARARHVLALPEDVVGTILAFGKLRARYACVVSCTDLRDGHARLAPAHEHSLLKRRFPILRTVLFGA